MTTFEDLSDEVIGEIFAKCDKCINWKQRTNLASTSKRFYELYMDLILFQCKDDYNTARLYHKIKRFNDRYKIDSAAKANIVEVVRGRWVQLPHQSGSKIPL